MREFSVTAYNYHGEMIDQVDVASLRCSWILNNIGMMEMIVPIDTAPVDALKFGRFIRFEHEVLPPWGGVIWGQRKWSADYVAITVYDGLFQFKRRITGGGAEFDGSSKALVTSLIDFANRKFDTGLRAGSLYDSVTGHTVGGDYVNLYDLMLDGARASGIDFMCRPGFDNRDRLVFYVDTMDFAGNPLNYAFEEGSNLRIESANMTELCNIVNSVVVFGDGVDGDVVQKAYAEVPDSIENYGLSEGAVQGKVNYGNFSQAEANYYVNKYRSDTASLNAAVLDVSNAWEYCRVGSRPMVWLYSVGFQGNSIGVSERKRIMAMQYNSDDESVICTFKD